jgi:hypothetical protein
MNRVAEHGSIPTTARHRLAGGLACCAALLLAAPALSAGAVPAAGAVLPLPLDAYTGEAGMSLWQLLVHRAGRDPVNLVATVVFLLAILHTFAAAPITAAAHRLRDRTARETRGDGHSFRVEILHFLGELEAVFGIWAFPLLLTAVEMKGWPAVESYVANVHYTEPMFVVVVMAIARPADPLLAESSWAPRAGAADSSRLVDRDPDGRASSGPFIEPAAMTICALLLARHLFELDPSSRLKYGTLGLLFVNVSVGGTLTHFAAPPVLMVAGKYGWGLTFMLRSFGWKAAVAILIATTAYAVFFRKEFALLAGTKKARLSDPVERPSERAVPTWIVLTHLLFLGWTVFTAHTPALFVAGFLYFLAFTQATAPHQNPLNLRPALLVGFFLAGLVLHGTLQQWWIAPVLARLDEIPLFFGATVLTAFNDNAAITYLASLVPGFTPELKYAVVAGAVTGGGLTVIANAPNPAGQSILSRYFPDGVRPIGLLLGALVPTAVVALAFLLLP